jgi:hypothetical protein
MKVFGGIRHELFYRFFSRVQFPEPRDLLIVIGDQDRV